MPQLRESKQQALEVTITQRDGPTSDEDDDEPL